MNPLPFGHIRLVLAALLLVVSPLCGQTKLPKGLTHTKHQLSEADREEIANHMASGSDWSTQADALREVLLAAKSTPDFTGPAWTERLWMATLFQWLGTPETELAVSYLSPMLENSVHQNNEKVPPKEVPNLLREMIRRGQLHAMLGRDFGIFFVDDSFAPGKGTLAERIDPDTVQFILRHPELLEELARTVNPRGDYLPGVFAVLQDLIKKNRKAVHDYPALAVALAVVYDQPVPKIWPHQQVSRRDLPYKNRPWNDLMAYFTMMNEEKELFYDLKDFDTERLKFVVDAPIDLAEFDWARKNVKTSRTSFDRVYFEVQYQDVRLHRAQYDWADGAYTLENILEQGGICTDQTYFAAMTGKAFGVPTLYFEGQGRDGGHAWIGYLRSKNRWETDTGRFATQKFVVGHAMDPQSWRPISDHQLEELTRDRPNGYRNRKSIKLLGLANLLGPDVELNTRLELLDAAIKADPGNAAVWQRKTQLLKEAGTRSYLITHLEDMAKKFHTNEELSIEIQRELANYFEEQNEMERAEELRESIIKSADRDRPDLAMRAIADQLNSLIRRKELGEFQAQFIKYLKRFGNDGGGNLFYTVVRPTLLKLQEQKQYEMVASCFRQARDRMTRNTGADSILAMDFANLEYQLNRTRGGEFKRQ